MSPSRYFPDQISGRVALVLFLLIGFLVPLPLTGQDAEEPGFTISIRAETPGNRHAVGETIRFLVEVTEGDLPWTAGSLSYTLSDDGYEPLETETIGLAGEPIIVTGKLERPGFLRCDVKAIRPGGEVVATGAAAAAVEPEHISPSREAPVDFDDFWSEQKQRLAASPIEVELVSVSQQGDTAVPDQVEAFDIKVRNHGAWPVSGYYARPTKAKPKSLPAVLWTHGAGVRSSNLAKAIEGANEGFLSLDINAHGIPNGKPESYYQGLSDELGRLHFYSTQGRENRDGCYFLGMFLRVIRAIDFLTAQPEWDGQVLAVIGHSQGGAQALVAGGLDPRVTFVGAGVPALCDHTGLLRRRVSGWPRLVPRLPDGKPDPVIAEVSRYYDVVNFAARCEADTIVSVGFIDRTCPPTSCYAAFNQVRGSLEILNEPEMGHAAPAEIRQAFWDALLRHRVERRNEVREAERDAE